MSVIIEVLFDEVGVIFLEVLQVAHSVIASRYAGSLRPANR